MVIKNIGLLFVLTLGLGAWVKADEECVAAVDAAESMDVNQKQCDYSDTGLNGVLHRAFAKKTTPDGAITENSVNLPANVFMEEFVSEDSDRRSMARLYMLGVMDVTEGEVWCGYNNVKTTTINEFVYEYFKSQTMNGLHKKRASHVIEDALKNNFPCKGSQ